MAMCVRCLVAWVTIPEKGLRKGLPNFDKPPSREGVSVEKNSCLLSSQFSQ